ncbi:transposase [Citrobacter braakii]|uniref:transposase n=1 Tax=Citrobacter braakii TaxID=57706 RepID=UPI0009BB7C78|nr:transposase [Citrobacter braakii]
MVERSDRPEISVAKLAREHGINDNRLFKWPNELCHYRTTPDEAIQASNAVLAIVS